MAASYVDTSALLKLYVPEVGSGWMSNDVQPSGIIMSRLATAEVGAALSFRVRDGSLTPQQGRLAWRRFRDDAVTFTVINVTPRSILRAVGIAHRAPVPLRTLDALQLQSAIEARAEAVAAGLAEPAFIAADARLLRAAQALGFTTDNPLNHI